MARGVVIGGLNSGGGSNIKSIQRGTLSLTSATRTVSINNVDLTKAVPRVTFYINGTPTPNQEQFLYVSAEITNSTTLTISVNGVNGYPLVVEWEVIEFDNVKSLQRGTATLSSTSANVTINSIDRQKSMLFCSFTTSGALGAIYTVPLSYTILNATSLQFNQSNANATKTIKWYVVEFN